MIVTIKLYVCSLRLIVIKQNIIVLKLGLRFYEISLQKRKKSRFWILRKTYFRTTPYPEKREPIVF